MKKLFKKIVAWLVLSSENSQQVSLTIKGVLGGAVTILTIVLGFAHLNVPGPEVFSQLIDMFVGIVQMLLLLVSSVAAIFGLLRKIYSTVIGENAVVNASPTFNP